MEKKIWPDYELHLGTEIVDLTSWVRKQDNQGVWYLIPVRMQWEFGEDHSHEVDIILDFIRRFQAECYKVLLFWKFPEVGQLIEATTGRPIGGEKDPSQISEKERLLPYLNTK